MKWASVSIKSAWLVLLVTGCHNTIAPAKEYPVASAADIARVSGNLQPGDALVMADGIWKDQAITLRAQGTADKPITLRAGVPGKVRLTGKSSLTIEGEYVVVSGVHLADGSDTKDGIMLKGNHCRLTESAVTGGDYKFFVHLSGSDNRVDHCYLADKTSESPTLQVEVEEKPNHHRIDHNYFGPRPPLGKNGGETMRVGYSGQSMRNSGTVVEYNLFQQCDGEIEIISNKSCENIYRYNTFLDCAGMLTLRHGNRCLVEGNFFIGHHKKESGGIRIIGEDHTIINNYIDGVMRGGFWITAGVPNSPLNAYFQAKNALIAFNTVVDSQGPCLELDAGMGTSERSLRPEKITIANNLFSLPANGTLLKGTEGAGFQWAGNIAYAADANPGLATHQGIEIANPKLERGPNGLWHPAKDSPARGAANSDLAALKAATIKTDIDGQSRKTPFDVGCDQASNEAVSNHPLTPAEVGPAWLERK